MKKLLTLMAVLLIAMLALAGCGGSEESSDNGSDSKESAAVDSLKTFSDVIALEKEDTQTSVGGGMLVYAFKYGDEYYRVSSKISEKTEKAYIDIDMSKEGYEKKQEELIGSVKIDKIENLNEQMLSEEDLDALKGKTGAELVKDGWTYNGSFDLENMEFWMDKGPFQYIVVFDGSADGANAENYDAEAETKDMKVKSVKFSMLGDATTLEQDSEE